jgi:hypothetical protein
MIGVRIPVEAGNSLLHRIQTGSEAHSAFCSKCTGGFSLAVKRPGREAEHLPPSSAESRKRGVTDPPAIRLRGMLLS